MTKDNSYEFQAGQLAAYFDCIKLLDRMHKQSSLFGSVDVAMLVALHRVSTLATEATK